MDISCYSREELGRQYSPSQWTRRTTPDKVITEHSRICATESARARNECKCTLDVRYGERPGQRLDILRGMDTPEDAPIFVFIHGGYWMACCKEEYDFIATPIVQEGYCFISVEYDLAPTVSLTEIVNEAREALRYIIDLARQSNSRSIYLCGHSAGAQLCVQALCSELEGQSSIVDPHDRQLIKGLILISGLYDVTPLCLTSENDVLKMTREEAWRHSPMNSFNVSALTTHLSHSDVIVYVAEHDSPQFKLQSQKYHLLLGDGGMKSKLLKAPDVDHFSIIENLRDSNDIPMKEILQLMKTNSN